MNDVLIYSFNTFVYSLAAIGFSYSIYILACAYVAVFEAQPSFTYTIGGGS